LILAKKEFYNRKTIALIIDALSGMGSYQEYIWHGVFKAAKATDKNLLIFPGGSIGMRPDNRYEHNRNIVYEIVRKANIDGIIFAGGSIGNYISHERFEQFVHRYDPIPRVSISGGLKGIPNIMIDNEKGFSELIEHLIVEHKYKKIAYIGGPEESDDAIKRLKAYKRVLAKHNMPFDEKLFYLGTFNEFSGHEAVRTWLDRRKVQFRAVVGANDNMALGALKELQLRGIMVPQQIAVAGFDDVVEAGVITPGLTTVRQPVQLQVEKAVEILNQMIDGKYVEQEMIYIDTEMIIRKSCGCTGVKQEQNEAIKIKENVSSRDWIETVAQIVTPYCVDESDPLLIKMLNVTLLDELQGKRQNVFLREWEEFVHNHLNKKKDMIIINKCLDTFRETSKYSGKSDETVAEILIYKAHNRFLEIVGRLEAKKRAQAESLSHTMGIIGMTLSVSFDLEELTDIITSVMPTLNIKNFIFGLYKEPLHPLEAVNVICRYRNGKRVKLPEEGLTLPAEQIVNIEFLNERDQVNYVIYPLFFKDKQLGLFLIELSPEYGFVYETMFSQICTSIEGALLVKRNTQVLKGIEQRSHEIENLTLPMLESIKEISEIATDKMEIVRELADQTQTSWNKISETSRNIENIASHMNKLLDIIKIIEDVVDKVNLLALNTSIEAAHMGQYGVGFSVIAKEIKKLSETTRKHSNEIAQTLKDIIKYTEDTSRYGQESIATFQSQKQGVQEILVSFEAISQKMLQLGDSSNTILNMMTKK
jgi:sigma-B regulation protein RsbU (phosphoserine phosphatase)